MANLQHLDVFACENRTLTLYARGSDNLVANLTGKTILWAVGRGPRSVDCTWAHFTKTGTTTDATGGAFTVPVTPSDTQYMCGDYEHQAETTDGSGLKEVVTVGRFRVRAHLGT